jgi:hypothetical protein
MRISNTPASIGIDEEGTAKHRPIEPSPFGSVGNVRPIEAIERAGSGSLNASRGTVA